MRSVDRVVVEAATALGMTPRQISGRVQLPLALPSIVAGVRVASVIGVGTATIAAAVGAGGLGEYIFRGLSMVDPTVILAGAVPAACWRFWSTAACCSRSGASSRADGAVGRSCRGRRRSSRWSCCATAVGAATRRAGGDPRRLEELHRADHPGRDSGADDRDADARSRSSAG